ncbi:MULTISPECIES: hypothetical protein [Pseudomonas]|uniref:hypothetical protein n=1 Tax=Pseudomonas TaxID=286 RepID=UPI002361EDC8|nr:MULTISPECIES: hypothetical protein [Pseudomonas]WJV25528.1 hypothetical protein PSR66_05660 [Pseudomonas chlororaphis]
MRTLNDSEISAVSGAGLIIKGGINGNSGLEGINIGLPGSGGKKGGDGVGIVINGISKDGNPNWPIKKTPNWPF